MSLVSEAFKGLFPDKEFNYKARIKYSRKFKGYNANVKYKDNYMEFGLSRKWKKISRETKLGLIQSLLLKIFKKRKNTTNIDLYNLFIKNIHIAVPKTKSDPILEESFEKLNEMYFHGLIDKPNLKWSDSVNKLGSYEYGTDAITITKMLKDVPREMLDYVMYHEMLHKKHKFKHKNGRSHHHTPEFKKQERMFPDSEQIENQLKILVTKNKIKKAVKRRFLDWF